MTVNWNYSSRDFAPTRCRPFVLVMNISDPNSWFRSVSRRMGDAREVRMRSGHPPPTGGGHLTFTSGLRRHQQARLKYLDNTSLVYFTASQLLVESDTLVI